MRRAFIDLGANNGNVSLAFARENPEFDIYCIEPNRELIAHITARAVQARRTFITMWAAAWIFDGNINLFQSSKNVASTVVDGKVERGPWPQIDYGSPTEVPCFDFSDWMLRTFTLRDHIVLKMDIEGAEYAILKKWPQIDPFTWYPNFGANGIMTVTLRSRGMNTKEFVPLPAP